MKYITIPKEDVIDEVAKDNDVYMVDRKEEFVEYVNGMSFRNVVVIIKDGDPENRYEFYKAVDE